MKKQSFLLLIFLSLFCNGLTAIPPNDLITTAEKHIQFKRDMGQLDGFVTPHTVIITYQPSVLQHLLKNYPSIKVNKAMGNFYVTEDNRVGIIGGFGIGAPALAVKVEQLAAFGVKRFIGVGTAGALLKNFEIGEYVIATKALAEDGVAHLYLDGTTFAQGNPGFSAKWLDYASDLHFHEGVAWSFSALFRERLSDIFRVAKQGCNIVEMETATLFAIARERGLEAVALYVVSDTIGPDVWVPHLTDPQILSKTSMLAERALQFAQTTSDF